LQDPHQVQARPSLIARVRRADMLVCSGSQLEIGWLPMLLSKANNPRVRPGTPGYLETGLLVRRLEVPTSIDRSRGDMHPNGNPHVQTNPHNIAIIATTLAARMQDLDPEHTELYQTGLAAFLTRWNSAITNWEQRAAPLRGKRVIVHHKSWVYLEDWLGLEEVGTLEPIPGIPPTAGHLSELLNQLGSDGQGADFILRAPYQDGKPSAWLAERTGIPALMLPLTVGGSPAADDLFGLFDDILDRLLQAQP
jgi:zinc/manganese transport system substrate-binding protein